MALRLFYLSLAGLLACGCVGHQSRSEECAHNLKQILILLRQATPTEPTFPATLAELAPFTTNTTLFVCPSTNHRAGQITNVAEWTDYIYITPADWEDSGAVPMATVICPPENHHGECGYVGFNDGTVRRVSPEEASRLIAEPWIESSVPVDVPRLKERTRVVLPKKADSFGR